MSLRPRSVLAMIDRDNELWLRSLRIPPLGEAAQTSVSLFLYSLFTILLPADDQNARESGNPTDLVFRRLDQVRNMIAFLQIPGDFDFPPIRALDDTSQSGDYVVGKENLNTLIRSVRQWLTPSAELIVALEEDLDERERKCEAMLRRLEELVSETEASQATLRRLQDFLKQAPEGSHDRAAVEKILAPLLNPEDDSLKDRQWNLTLKRRREGDS